MQNRDSSRSLRTFWILWASLLLSGIGSSLSGFAFGIWIFQETGSALQFAITSLSFVLPFALLAPIAGTLVDRWDRRLIMIGADTGQALVTAIIAWLLWEDRLAVWHLYGAAALSAGFGAFYGPAYGASIPLLVPKEQLVRVGGLGRLSGSMSRLLAPLLAGVLVVRIGLEGIVLLDLATFLIAVVAYGLIRIPQPPRLQKIQDQVNASNSRASNSQAATFWQDLRFGWRYLVERPGLLGIVWVGGLLNLFGNIANTIQVPLILSFTDADAVGVVLACSAAGGLLSGLLMSTWGGPMRLVPGIFALIALAGIGYLLAGVQLTLWLIALGFFLAAFALSGSGILMTALQQRKVALAVQGRVFGTEGMIALLFEAAAYPLAGLLADQIFEPAMQEGQWLATLFGRWIGTGLGRGMGLQILLMGGCLLVVAGLAYLSPHVRYVEQELPDHG